MGAGLQMTSPYGGGATNVNTTQAIFLAVYVDNSSEDNNWFVMKHNISPTKCDSLKHSAAIRKIRHINFILYSIIFIQYKLDCFL